MKLLTIDCREVGGRPGVVLPNGDILDLASAPSTLNQAQWIPYSVISVLAAGNDGLERVAKLVDAANSRGEAGREQLRRDGALLPFAGTALLPPVRRPGLILIVDDDGTTYIKSPNTAVGNAVTVEVPWHKDAPLECSGLLAAVMGRALYRADCQEAGNAIAGYTLMLDLSAARTDDWKQYIEGKQFPGAGPMGPVIVTKDEFGDPRSREMQLSLNGVVVASDPTYAGAEDLPDRLAAMSQRYSFRPGDLICFEAPRGAAIRDCKLHAGDAVQLSVGGIMALDVNVA